MERALISLGPAELEQLLEDQGEAELTCRFCDNVQHFSREDLERMLADMRKKVNRNATVPREGSEGGSLPRQAFERQEAAVRMGQKQVQNRASKKVEKNLNLGLTERGSLRIITFVV